MTIHSYVVMANLFWEKIRKKKFRFSEYMGVT